MNINQIVYIKLLIKLPNGIEDFCPNLYYLPHDKAARGESGALLLMNVNQMVYKMVNQHGILDFYPISYFLLEAAQGVLSGVRDNPVQQRITELHCCSFSPLWLC